jgi:DNA-directed RNA polymerase specialized sigma24 family protein
MDDSEVLKSIDKKLSALLALTALGTLATDAERVSVKPELMLNKAGLSAEEISKILGKKPDAVRKAIQRAGK